jgi:hypothetical protein
VHLPGFVIAQCIRIPVPLANRADAALAAAHSVTPRSSARSIIFALRRSYEAGLRDGGRAAKQPAQTNNDQQAAPDALDCSIGSTPQREVLFRRLLDAVMCELLPDRGRR